MSTPGAGKLAPGDIAAVALALFGIIAAAVTIIAIVESYSNLLAFALDHGLHGWRAAIAPAAVDSFIVMGELLLFAGLLLGWDSAAAYCLGAGMAIWGFLLSVGGNIWHSPSASLTDRLVAAVWPVTATAGLAGGLIIIKRVMATGNRVNLTSPAGNSPAGEPSLPDPARRGPRREARSGQALAAVPRVSGTGEAELEAKREARRKAGRRGAAIRWGKDLEAVPAGVNGNGHDGT